MFSQDWGRSSKLFSFVFTFLINEIEDLRTNLYLCYWTLSVMYSLLKNKTKKQKHNFNKNGN